ncbi:type VII secretion protein EccE [Amycolatopsis minnesotensis]|uniref:Type VII secretion protein EccE n=1 Tax=Amycolatopsis minnesotensis TaxID=337894 RepID=A0ABP5DJS2_9PSEU
MAAPLLFPVRVRQIAVWELAAVAVLTAFGFDDVPHPLRIAVASVAAVAVLATSIRIGGAHFAGWAAAWLGYRFGRRDEPLTGDVEIREHVDRAGNRFGVARAGDGWSCVIRLAGTASASPAALRDGVLEAFRRPEIPLASAQVLVWTVPGPDGGAPLRVRWLAVRYRPEAEPLAATARGGGELGAMRATVSAALRIVGGFANSGWESAVLDAAELEEDLRVALGARDGEVADNWRAWRSGDLTQTCHAPLGRQDSARVLDGYADGAAFTATSLLVHRDPGGHERITTTIRIGATGHDAHALPFRTRPLHGRHAAHVRLSLPLALS